jgi:adenosylcobinamide-GDP ribazoletransferase
MLGALMAGLGRTLIAAGLDPLPIAATLVTVLAIATRGLHLDGLADTVDALASYTDRDRALAIMKSPEVGPMGAAAIGCVLIVDTAALSSLLARHAWLAIVVGAAVGRLAITVCCRRGVPAARPDGLGAVVAGTVPMTIPLIWTVVLLAGNIAASHRHWTGVVALALPLAVIVILLRHVRRRLGGVTGDVLGAACEIATALALLGLCLN